MTVIDAHHHLWRYNPAEYGWIGDHQAVIRRDFLPDHLAADLHAAGVTGAVAVQARTAVVETEWLLSLAIHHPEILGVVGWVPLASPQLREILDRFAGDPLLVGVREVAEDNPGALDDPALNRGIAALAEYSLCYDILVRESQLPEATRLVDRHPEQLFVLDHIAKPRIREGIIEPWASGLRALAERPNIVCKLSGLVTEADYRQWTEAQLQPYFEVVLAAFGPERLMFGSDWPVCLLALDYQEWREIVGNAIARLSAAEQAAIMGGTARRVYGL
jgi:L-fuconolactonase